VSARGGEPTAHPAEAGTGRVGAASSLAESDWESFLEARLARPVRVVYGRSRTSPLQARRTPPGRTTFSRDGAEWLLRLHTMFRGAPTEVREAVADLLRAGRRAKRSCAVLDAWIAANLPRHPPPRVPDASLVQRGKHHDLAAIAAGILAKELEGEFGAAKKSPRFTWGTARGRAPRRAMRLGSYDADVDVVRVHPALDQEGVPEWFVRYVLFHELLHAVYPPVRGSDGRWIRHGRSFQERERDYPGLERALAWERRNIDALIRSARTKKPLPAGRRTRSTAMELVQMLFFPEAADVRARARRPRRA
jgi:hypothetical protein